MIYRKSHIDPKSQKLVSIEISHEEFIDLQNLQSRIVELTREVYCARLSIKANKVQS